MIGGQVRGAHINRNFARENVALQVERPAGLPFSEINAARMAAFYSV
jgi:hypothetical protein